ncbi:hypothetical protein O3G_MSEX009025 [Manduca sexta]|uniref:Uncharacterized protein n=1 Tax=Manduca sexta TaxID=7130 RepID=A0A922CR33_MANSE|nr:hypothetical protein O3G_MSEX009025 [Manduca sexta]
MSEYTQINTGATVRGGSGTKRFTFWWARGPAFLRPSLSRPSRGEGASAAERTPGAQPERRGRARSAASPARTPEIRVVRDPCPPAPSLAAGRRSHRCTRHEDRSRPRRPAGAVDCSPIPPSYRVRTDAAAPDASPSSRSRQKEARSERASCRAYVSLCDRRRHAYACSSLSVCPPASRCRLRMGRAQGIEGLRVYTGCYLSRSRAAVRARASETNRAAAAGTAGRADAGRGVRTLCLIKFIPGNKTVSHDCAGQRDGGGRGRGRAGLRTSPVGSCDASAALRWIHMLRLKVPILSHYRPSKT